jgi:hypothetical protein
MGSDTIYFGTHVCMIGTSHAAFVSHWCLQGTVSHIKSYWCLGGFGLDDSFRERVRGLIMGLKTYILNDSLLHPSWVLCVFNLKNFLRRRFSVFRAAEHFSAKHATPWSACCYGKVHLLLDVELSACASQRALCKIACMGLSLLSKHV